MAHMKDILELEALMTRLDEAGDDEAAIERAFDVPEFESEELSADELASVSGGAINELSVIKWLVKNTKCGQLTWKATTVAARCLYDYFKYGNAYKTYSQSYVSSLNSDLEKSIPKWIKALQ